MNTIIFLQGKLSNESSYKVQQSALKNAVRWSKYDKLGRMILANSSSIKFGFVLKSLKTC